MWLWSNFLWTFNFYFYFSIFLIISQKIILIINLRHLEKKSETIDKFQTKEEKIGLRYKFNFCQHKLKGRKKKLNECNPCHFALDEIRPYIHWGPSSYFGSIKPTKKPKNSFIFYFNLLHISKFSKKKKNPSKLVSFLWVLFGFVIKYYYIKAPSIECSKFYK